MDQHPALPPLDAPRLVIRPAGRRDAPALQRVLEGAPAPWP